MSFSKCGLWSSWRMLKRRAFENYELLRHVACAMRVPSRFRQCSAYLGFVLPLNMQHLHLERGRIFVASGSPSFSRQAKPHKGSTDVRLFFNNGTFPHPFRADTGNKCFASKRRRSGPGQCGPVTSCLLTGVLSSRQRPDILSDP